MQQRHGIEAVAALVKKALCRVVGAAKHSLKNAHKARIHLPPAAIVNIALTRNILQCLAVNLARGRNRHGLKHMPGRGNHVRRQAATAPRNHRFYVGPRLEHKKRRKAGLAASIFNRQHGSLADDLAIFEQAGHFGQFNTVAANFHLIVSPAQQQNFTLCRPQGQVARSIKPRPTLVRQAHKALLGHIWLVVVAKGHAGPANPQFTWHARWQLAPLGIADGERNIGNRPPHAYGLRLKGRNFLHCRANAGFRRAVGVEIAQRFGIVQGVCRHRGLASGDEHTQTGKGLAFKQIKIRGRQGYHANVIINHVLTQRPGRIAALVAHRVQASPRQQGHEHF